MSNMSTVDRTSKGSRRVVKKKSNGHKVGTPYVSVTKRDEHRSLAKQIGERLHLARRSRGLSQMDLAVACEVTRAAVSQWERGGTMADQVNIRKMAEKLNVPVEWIEEGSNEPQLTKPIGHTRVVRRRHNDMEKPPFNGAVAEMEYGLGNSSSFGTENTMHDWWRLPPRALDSLGAQAANLRAYRIVRETLEGFPKTDIVFVDITQKEIQHNCVYILDFETGLSLKRVEVTNDAGVVILSDKSGSRQFKLNRKSMDQIIGRCVARFAQLQ